MSRHRLILLQRAALVSGATALVLAGCQGQLALNCRSAGQDTLHVAKDQSCRFNYHGGDAAKYVVKIVKPPVFGDATGEGKYLKYTAKPGFTGEDRMTIKVERRGIGHVQWQTHNVKVKVGLSA